MLFHKKGKMRKEEDERLLAMLEEAKQHLTNLRQLVDKSVDPSPLVIYEMHLVEAKYLFLLREARHRKAMKGGNE